MKLCDLTQILNQQLVSKNTLTKVNEYQFQSLGAHMTHCCQRYEVVVQASLRNLGVKRLEFLW